MKKMLKNTFGFSLIEILVVIGSFAILSVIATLAISYSVRGTKKSESIQNVRSEVDSAMQIMSRQLRNASSIISACSGTPTTSITFVDQRGATTSFDCVNIGSGSGYIASASASLTTTEIDITSCQFTCTRGAAGTTDSVKVNLSAQDKTNTGIESAGIDVQTQINLRNY